MSIILQNLQILPIYNFVLTKLSLYTLAEFIKNYI